MAMILNQIAVNSGPPDQIYDALDGTDGFLLPRMRPAGVLIEYTDPLSGTDVLLEFTGVNSIGRRIRPTLYQDHTIVQPGKDAREASRLAKTAEELREQNLALAERADQLDRELRAEREKKAIGSVEVWTYDAKGRMADHYILDADDHGEDIPIGNVVVAVKKETP